MNSTMAKRHAHIGIAAFSALLSAHAASAAAPPVEYKTTVVNYSDLNLSRSEDVRRLYRRIRFAAGMVCDGKDSKDLEVHQSYEACRIRAIETSVAQVRSPQLTSIHEAATRHLPGG